MIFIPPEQADASVVLLQPPHLHDGCVLLSASRRRLSYIAGVDVVVHLHHYAYC